MGALKQAFDSDILIDYLQGIEPARAVLEQCEHPVASIITWIEVMTGARNKAQRQAVEILFSGIEIVALTGIIAALAVDIRQKERLKLPDAIILATAIQNQCPLLTRNTKDFDHKDTRVRVPYAI